MEYSVFLRPFKESDAEKINQWRNDPKVHALTVGRFRLVSLEIEKQWVRDKMTHNTTEEYFAICLVENPETMIGYCSISDIDFYNRKVRGSGIVIDPEYQVGTYMVDAHLLILDYAFNKLGINRFTGSCLEEHTSSRVMMEMLGFKLEGIERESAYKWHKYHNICKYAILYSEYKELLDNSEYSLIKIAKRAKSISKQYKNKKNGN